MINPQLWGWSSSPLSIYAWGWDEVDAGAANVLTGIPHFVYDDIAWPIARGVYRPQTIGHSYQVGRAVQSGSVVYVAMSDGGYSVNHAIGTGTRINRGESALTAIRCLNRGARISRDV